SRKPRRSGRVAEGGALLRRYGGLILHRGFESLLLRRGARGKPGFPRQPSSDRSSRAHPGVAPPTSGNPGRRYSSRAGGVAERSNAAVSKTVIRASGSEVQILSPPFTEPGTRLVMRVPGSFCC